MSTCMITPSGYAAMFMSGEDIIYAHYLSSNDAEQIIQSVNRLVKEADLDRSVTVDVPHVIIIKDLHHPGYEDLVFKYCDAEHVYLIGKYKSLDRRRDDLRELKMKIAIKDIVLSHSYKEAV